MHVVVTGASAGIGEAIAREWAAAGAELTLLARRRENLERLERELGVRCKVIVADLSDARAACAWLREAEAEMGPTDVLVNNAGVQIVAPALKTDPEDGERLLRLNVFTPMRLVLEVLPGMISRRAGTIVNVASVASLAPTPGMFYYNASKAGLAAASESLAGELRGTGVHVVTVYPGPVDTDMARAAFEVYGEDAPGMKVLPRGTAPELARRIRRAAERRQPRVIYPAAYAVTRWFPGTTRWALDRFTPPAAAQGQSPG
jgi:short-subunit dehydrogenase